jgi:CheY-like chemotaxis protein
MNPPSSTESIYTAAELLPLVEAVRRAYGMAQDGGYSRGARLLQEVRERMLAEAADGTREELRSRWEAVLRWYERFREQQPAGSGTQPERASPDEGPRPLRVLVIDDYPDAADSLVELLSIRGHEARATHDFSMAVPLARLFEPDLVLCGWSGRDGPAMRLPQLCRQFGVDGAHFVAAVTLGGDGVPERLRAAGFDGWLLKPFGWEELRPLLDRDRR